MACVNGELPQRLVCANRWSASFIDGSTRGKVLFGVPSFVLISDWKHPRQALSLQITQRLVDSVQLRVFYQPHQRSCRRLLLVLFNTPSHTKQKRSWNGLLQNLRITFTHPNLTLSKGRHYLLIFSDYEMLVYRSNNTTKDILTVTFQYTPTELVLPRLLGPVLNSVNID